MAGEIYSRVAPQGQVNALSQFLNLKRVFVDAQRQSEITSMRDARKMASDQWGREYDRETSLMEKGVTEGQLKFTPEMEQGTIQGQDESGQTVQRAGPMRGTGRFNLEAGDMAGGMSKQDLQSYFDENTVDVGQGVKLAPNPYSKKSFIQITDPYQRSPQITSDKRKVIGKLKVALERGLIKDKAVFLYKIQKEGIDENDPEILDLLSQYFGEKDKQEKKGFWQSLFD